VPDSPSITPEARLAGQPVTNDGDATLHQGFEGHHGPLQTSGIRKMKRTGERRRRSFPSSEYAELLRYLISTAWVKGKRVRDTSPASPLPSPTA